MKRKLFSPGLYLDSLRRTALIGGLFTVLLCIQSLIICFGYKISLPSYENISVRTVGLLEIDPMLLVVPILMIPLLMINLFGFLNKRSTSDFWHSTPFTRECIFISFNLAALTWAVATILVSSAVSVIGFLTMPDLFAINFSSVLYCIVGTVVLTLLVMGAFTISASLTGTTFNNLIVACLILFLPRALIIYFGAITSHNVLFSNIPAEGFGSMSINLLFGALLGSVMGTDDITEVMASFTSTGYTLVLAIVYFAIGLVLFKHRKSETASYSAVNKYMQTAFRSIVAFIVCLVPIYMITDYLNSGHSFTSEEIFLCFVLYVIAIIAYFLYELISTKKAKNMLKAIPTIWILAVANIVMIIAAHGVYKSEYNYTPSAETVTSIRIASNDSINSRDYFEKIMSKTDISDDELEKFLCDLYADTRKAYENDTLWRGSHQTVTVGFKSGADYKYRNIFMDAEEYEKFGQLLDKNDDVKGIYDIENIFKEAVYTDIYVYLNGEIDINGADREAIKNAYIEDVKNMSFAEWYSIANSPYDYVITAEDKETAKHYNEIGSMSVSINIDGSSYYAQFPITNQMPKAYSLIIGKCFEYQQENDLQNKVIELISDTNGKEKSAYVELYNGKTLTPSEGYSLYDKATIQKFIEAITPALGQKPDATSRIATLNYYCRSENDYENYTVIFKVPDDADLTFFLGNNMTTSSGSSEDTEIIP